MDSQTRGVELRSVALNIAALLQPLYPVVDRGRLEADERPELTEGRARVALQRVEDPQVELVESFNV